jgi:hypothetical protein
VAAHYAKTGDGAKAAKKEDTPWVKPTPDQTTILLFYAYCQPQWTRAQQDDALNYTWTVLEENGMTGRLRLGREGSYCIDISF